MKSKSPACVLKKLSMAILAAVAFLHPLAASAEPFATWPGDGFVMNTYMGSGIAVGIDHTTLESLTYRGQDWRYIYDRRVGFTTNQTWRFKAVWEDGHETEFLLNSEFAIEEAREHAEVFADIVGRLPKFARHDVDYVIINGGSGAGGGGGGTMIYHIDSTYPTIYNYAYSAEELMLHEAGHNDLSNHWNAPGWIAAQQADGRFISQYAEDFPEREDVTVSMTNWFAVRHRPERCSQGYIDWITDTIPNRLAYFDSLNLDPYPANKPIAAPFIDSTSSLVTYAPSASEWGAWNIPGSFLDYVHYSNIPGATATFEFTGTKATLYGVTRQDLGIAEILIDGVSAGTVDFYSSGRATFQALFETPVLPAGNHTLTVKVTGTHNPAATATDGEIIIDAVQYIADIPVDTDPPTPTYSIPSAATWASVPHAVSGTAIRMEATVGCDISHPIEYYFEETSGNPGGTDSGWQRSRFYTDTGLALNAEYSYTVRMRDALHNEGAVSIAESATTAAIDMTNFFTASYTGTRNDHTGWAGYEFTPSVDLTVEALGRSVSTSILHDHNLKIWRVSDQSEVASVTVTPASGVFLGYAYEKLPTPIALNSGVTYRIASWETNGGDAFRDVGNISDHTAVARINAGVWGRSSDTYPAFTNGGTDNGYVPATFFYEASTVDVDGDGMTDENEMIAGTDPNDPSSIFNLRCHWQEGGFVLEWPAFPNRKYQVYRADSPAGPFNPVGPVLYFPQNSYTDSAPPLPASFYRVGVQQQ